MLVCLGELLKFSGRYGDVAIDLETRNESYISLRATVMAAIGLNMQSIRSQVKVEHYRKALRSLMSVPGIQTSI